jgi:hypothetical protein
MSPRKNKNGTTTTVETTKKISRDDIEAKLRELQGEVDENLDTAKGIAMPIAIGAGVLALLIVYFLGRRRGRKRQLVLEIKRI